MQRTCANMTANWTRCRRQAPESVKSGIGRASSCCSISQVSRGFPFGSARRQGRHVQMHASIRDQSFTGNMLGPLGTEEHH